MVSVSGGWWKPWRWERTELQTSDLRLVQKINADSGKLQNMPDQHVRDCFQELRLSAENLGSQDINTPDNELIVAAFSCVKEAARRTKGMQHHDVQILAGISMARGSVAEMATGEGKTLVATLPASVFALWGNGVHVMTVNAYLARRDFESMSPIYRLLGLQVGHIESKMVEADKRQAYNADITYGVGNDFGFDYLRDQLKLAQSPKIPVGMNYRNSLRGLKVSQPEPAQRGHAFAVIDESDSVMVDEANSALILSGSSGDLHPDPMTYQLATRIVDELQEGSDYYLEEEGKKVTVSESGLRKGMDQLEHSVRLKLVRPWETYINKAIFAKHLCEKDVDYIVKDESVQIVDSYTGRRHEDRTWSYGLHQAVESKEGVPITEESASILKISRQRFFRMYEKCCGMTGTALGCQQEFKQFFNMGVKKIPLHRESKRTQLPLEFYESDADKWDGILAMVKKIHRTGAPVLVGTQSIRESERFADRLGAIGIPCNVINARYDADEARLVEKAGQLNAVTVATNMAGRGTDIPIDNATRPLGGLFVILTEPHLSQRIDRQLIGRCARQGDPGTAITFSCKEDKIFKAVDFTRWGSMKSAGKWDCGKIAEKTKSIQSGLDQDSFLVRQNLLRHDKWKVELMKKLA